MRNKPVQLAFIGSAVLWHFHEILAGLENYCAQSGVSGLVRYLGKKAFEPSIFERISEIDGVVSCVEQAQLAPYLPRRDLPVIQVSGRHAGGRVRRALNDDRGGGRLAARHLMRKGVASLCSVRLDDARYALQREAGLLEEAAREGVPAETFDFGVNAPRDQQSFRRELEAAEAAFVELVRGMPQPVGIFGIQDSVALQVLDLLKEAGIAVPETARVVGFDDLPEADEHRPSLSSVAPDSRGIGFLAGSLLEDWIRNGAVPPLETLVAPLGVEERESTGGQFFEDPVVLRLTDRMRSRMADPPAVDELARMAGCSRRALEVRFRRVTGSSPYHWLLQQRLQHARQLLRESLLPIEEVAAACGFSDLNSLGMAFRRHLGMSPTRYRKIHRVR